MLERKIKGENGNSSRWIEKTKLFILWIVRRNGLINDMMELFFKLGMFIIDIIKKPEIDVEEIEFVGEKEDC